MKFIIDENLPKRIAYNLVLQGLDTIDLRNTKLTGCSKVFYNYQELKQRIKSPLVLFFIKCGDPKHGFAYVVPVILRSYFYKNDFLLKKYLETAHTPEFN